jgi:hypothetical protein
MKGYAMPQAKTKRGNKPEPGKRYPLNMRTTLGIRQMLERVAESSGRSLAQEVEHRLVESFTRDHVIEIELGGQHTYLLLKMLANVIQGVEHITGKRWPEDKETFSKALTAVYGILGKIGPLPHEQVTDYLIKNKKDVGLDAAGALFDYAGFTDPQIKKILKFAASIKRDSHA